MADPLRRFTQLLSDVDERIRTVERRYNDLAGRMLKRFVELEDVRAATDALPIGLEPGDVWGINENNEWDVISFAARSIGPEYTFHFDVAWTTPYVDGVEDDDLPADGWTGTNLWSTTNLDDGTAMLFNGATEGIWHVTVVTESVKGEGSFGTDVVWINVKDTTTNVHVAHNQSIGVPGASTSWADVSVSFLWDLSRSFRIEVNRTDSSEVLRVITHTRRIG